MKDLPERLREMKEIYKKMEELGIHKRFECMKPFYEHVQEYIKDGNSVSGKIKILEIQRILYYNLTSSSGRESSVLLRHYS